MSISSGVGIAVAVVLLALIVYFRMGEESLSAIKSLSSTMPKMGEKIDGLKKIAGAMWFKKFAGWVIFALFIFFIAWPWVNERYERTEVAQAQAQAEYLRTHPQFPSDTTFWFTARSNTFGKSWVLPREVQKGYTMEINAEELDVSYVVATQAKVDTIRPSMKTVDLGFVRTLAFKTLRDSTLRIGVRFYK